MRAAALLPVAAALLQGCLGAGIPLETARTAVRAAESDPLVSLYALPDLETAERQLEVAETARSPA